MAATEQFSLRWNNFYSNLTSGFHELFQAAEMVDVTLAVDGQFLQAHKIVLSICSPYFKQMFRVNPCKHPIVILKDVRPEHMKDILEFMYMGEVNVLRENLTAFLRTAELLQVKGLTGDDSSETSSKEDDKIDCDNDIEEESEVVQNSLLDSDLELPSYSSSAISAQNLSTSNKRQQKNFHSSGAASNKRSKADNNGNHTNVANKQSELETYNKIKQGVDEEPEYGDLNMMKLDKSMEDEGFENLKYMLEKSSTTAGTDNSGDNDFYSGDMKPHVYCPYCERKFVNRYNLKVHVRDKHEDNTTNLDCSVCGKRMRNRSCLRVHMYHHRKQQLEALEPSALPPTLDSNVL